MPARDDLLTQTEVLRPGEPLRLRTRKLRVDIVAGPNAGSSAQLSVPEARVDSGAGCDLVLADTTVSRHHLTLKVEPGGVRVVDAGSRNGTTVDGVRVFDAYARNDSSIGLGNTMLRLQVLADVVELPLSSRDRFGGLLGASTAMRRVFTVLERVAPGDETVLIEGETGTGKEIAAEAIHEESPRAAGPYVVFDCSAVAANLMDSELFGHVRGAFTGATTDRQGTFERADGGTLFLDEVGELPLDLQPKLLRALERLEVRPVGSNTARRVDVRIIAATNRNLGEEVARGRFREDLLYRLAVVRVALPPLRERLEDIPMLVAHFAHALRRGRSEPLEGGARQEQPVDERVVRSLMARAWPGNVRELRNAVARTLSLGAPDPAAGGGETAPPSVDHPDLGVPLMEARDELAARFEEAYLREALRRAGGSAVKAAELAGVNRKFMQRAMKRYGLRG